MGIDERFVDSGFLGDERGGGAFVVEPCDHVDGCVNNGLPSIFSSHSFFSQSIFLFFFIFLAPLAGNGFMVYFANR
jgi:hypothetical protein